MGSSIVSYPALCVDEHRHRGTITLKLSGELDIAGVDVLEAHLARLRRTYRGRLVIDLSGLTFLSSTGIAVLVQAYHYARNDGWVLELRQGPAAVRRALEVSGVLERLPFSPD